MIRPQKTICLLIGVALLTLNACARTGNVQAASKTVSAVNLAPDSMLRLRRTYWTTSAPSMQIRSVGQRGDGYFIYAGTGGRSGYIYASSVAIAVEPGQMYTLSGDIDALNVLSGRPEWAVMDLQLHRVFATAGIDYGLNARVSATFTVPAGVTEVKILCDTVNAVVRKGASLTFSRPRLAEGSSAAYVQSTGLSAQ